MIKWLLIPLIILINYFTTFVPHWQIDLTANKLHSLSPATRKIISEMDKDVEIRVFMSENIPPEARNLAGDLKNILRELEGNNRQKLKLTYADPIKDDKVKEEAAKYGIQQLQFSSIKSDKFEVQNGYFGMVIRSGEKYEAIPVASDVGSLEYTIVSAIKKITADKLNTIAVAVDPKSVGQVQLLERFLTQNFAIIKVEINGDKEIPAEAQSLVIVGQSQKLDEKGDAKLRKWLDSGKPVIAFVDKVEVDGNLVGKKIEETGLEKIFEKYGIKIQNGLIIDASSAIANFRSQNGTFVVQYPYWVNVLPANIDFSVPALSGLNSLTLPWASALTVEGKAKTLFTSSGQSELDDNASDLSPMGKRSLSGNSNGKLAIGAMRNDEIRLAVVADSDFVKDQFVQNSQQNMGLALNLIDYFSGDSSLLTIRNKTASTSPIVSVSDQQKLIIRTLAIGMPIIILGILYTLITLRRRKN